MRQVHTEESESTRGEKLVKALNWEKTVLESKDLEKLQSVLVSHNDAFNLSQEERGETDLVKLSIQTGDAPPKKLPVRRVPFAIRRELAQQLQSMERNKVIQPSNSPWASPIVLVRKKDRALRFCVDYRALNAVTKLDTFPIPRIDDLLDQLNGSQYFSTLDLAAGYWQIKLDVDSVEKTAFITPHGLYEFRVMPFGLANAPAVFQQLMQQVLLGLNPPSGQAFMSVYIDDILIFSRTLEEHMRHIEMVLKKIVEAGLKLKPSKCFFVRRGVSRAYHHFYWPESQPREGACCSRVSYSSVRASGASIFGVNIILPPFYSWFCQYCISPACVDKKGH